MNETVLLNETCESNERQLGKKMWNKMKAKRYELFLRTFVSVGIFFAEKMFSWIDDMIPQTLAKRRDGKSLLRDHVISTQMNFLFSNDLIPHFPMNLTVFLRDHVISMKQIFLFSGIKSFAHWTHFSHEMTGSRFSLWSRETNDFFLWDQVICF